MSIRTQVIALLLAILPAVSQAQPANRYAADALLQSPAGPVKLADWPQQRQRFLGAMQRVMGPLPPAGNEPLDIKVLATVETPAYTRQSIVYTSELHQKTQQPERVTAFLFIPKNLRPDEKRPGIVALHPTSKLGKAEITGDGKANRQYGVELAERGYVVICPDYPSFGDYTKDFAASNHPSGTMQGIVNHRRAVDLLLSLPQVDTDHIGAIGHSLGGHNSLFLAAFDERVKVAVTSCGWNLFPWYYQGKLAGWSSDRYMPRIRTEFDLSPAKMPFDFHEVIACIAPRAVLSISPLKDANFEVEGVRQAVPCIAAVYALHHKPMLFRVEYPDCAHDFPPEMRKAAYEFIDQHLGRQPVKH